MRGLYILLLVSCFFFASAYKITRLASSEPVFQDVRALVVDHNNHGYLVSYGSSTLFEVNLNSLRVLRTATLPFPRARSLAIDASHGRLFIGFETNPGTVLRWDLGTWKASGNVTTFHSPRNLIFNADDSTLLVGTYPAVRSTGVIHKINGTTLQVLDTVELPTGFRARTMVYDTSRHYLYVGNDGAPASVARIWVEPTLARSDVITFPKNWDETSASVIDGQNSFAYFGLVSPVGRIAKIDLSTFTWVDTISTAGEGFSAAGIDNARGFAYFVSNEIPSALYRVRLCDFTLLDLEHLQQGDGFPSALHVRELSGIITVGTGCHNTLSCSGPSGIIKLQVTDVATCEKSTSSQPQHQYLTTVNFRFAGMIPSPSCCPPPEYFQSQPDIVETCSS
eukprot:TRINITY_DN4164_c0_g4_i1.p1 TRINITY_DN4164_c0_g4~~TRINITY_DN4164_c0_g4_i1.p1  ORF type:complete len:394 (+),score=102.00 TRINITY_DN4164_c0_g4_i1:106-1287(+)